MREFQLNIPIKEYAYDELPAEYKMLIDKAKAKVQDAYSPYSQFSVGAAVKMADGQVFAGCNQENAAYPSGLCAERTTLFYAQAQCPTVAVDAIAIAAYTNGAFVADPLSPCGACRQVMVEYEDRHKHDMKVLLYGEKAVFVLDSAKDLMPFCFVKDSLLG